MTFSCLLLLFVFDWHNKTAKLALVCHNFVFLPLKMTSIMNKFRLSSLIILLGLVSSAFAQDGVGIGNWRTHLPYRKVIGVEPIGQRIYAATEYELFYYDKEDNSINILNKVNGLSDIGISKIRYNESQRKLFVAYTNSNVDLIDSNGNVHNMSDIKNNKSIIGNKTINNVRFDGDLAYVACGFGIVVFDLKREEVKDTYYIGDHGDAVNVTDIAFFNGGIYACSTDGVYWAQMSSPNLANYSAWSFMTNLIYPHLDYNAMEVFDGKLLLNYDGGFNADTVFVYNGSGWYYFDKENVSQKTELRAYDDCLVMTNRYSVMVFDRNWNQTMQIYLPGGSIEPLSTAIDNVGDFWIGDSKRGLIKTSDGWNNMDVLPNGPASKNVFQLQSSGDQVWIATGGYGANWSKRYMKEGVARFDGLWSIFNSENTPSLQGYSDFICTATNPNDPSVTYVGTWGHGLLKLKDGEVVEVYNASNSTLDYWVADIDPKILISGLAFDSHGNLWVANSGASNPLSVMERDGTWHSCSLGGSLGGIDIGNLMVDHNNYKWILRRGGEIVVFNDNGTLDISSDDRVARINTAVGSGALAGSANCFAVDRSGVVWIGTTGGPCLISDSRKIFDGSNFDATKQKVPRNDGTDQYDFLFDGSNVLSMAVDGSNSIWFGLETGVYLVAQDRNSTLLHSFNTENSPLLENSVNAMAIDSNGEVFFGTGSGVISYRAQATPPSPEVSDVVAFPNPVYQGYQGYVGIKGLVENSLVRITTVDGAFVTQLMSEGGQAVWDCTTVDGRKVSPGVYLIFTSTKDGANRFATKILILN